MAAFQQSLRAGVVLLAMAAAARGQEPPAPPGGNSLPVPGENSLPAPADFQPNSIADQYASEAPGAASSLIEQPCQS
ncbi:MAG TPA: hypothetical protein VGN42_03590, partial [Pirellulales bacterium]|nr:hypothetical protein [Pirellulales bacterium]